MICIKLMTYIVLYLDLGSNWQRTIIGLDNVLTPYWWQAIIWTNDSIIKTQYSQLGVYRPMILIHAYVYIYILYIYWLLYWPCRNHTIAPVLVQATRPILINLSFKSTQADNVITTEQGRTIHVYVVWYTEISAVSSPSFLGPLLLTWFNFNPSMDK